jgi:hypothetical protein
LPYGRYANVYYTASTAFIRIEDSPRVAEASVSGRALSSDGRGITNAVVTLTEASGISYTAVTTRTGAFRFEHIPAGSSYVATISARRFSFEPQSLEINGSVSDLVFIGAAFSR